MPTEYTSFHNNVRQQLRRTFGEDDYFLYGESFFNQFQNLLDHGVTHVFYWLAGANEVRQRTFYGRFVFRLGRNKFACIVVGKGTTSFIEQNVTRQKLRLYMENPLWAPMCRAMLNLDKKVYSLKRSKDGRRNHYYSYSSPCVSLV